MVRKYYDFIKSSLNEADFYKVSSENSITLDEYMDKMHDTDRKFHKIANSEILSIRTKLDWVSSVDFYVTQKDDRYKEEHRIIFIYMNTVEGYKLCVYKYNKRDFDLHIPFPKFAYFNKEFNSALSRREELVKIREELEEIGQIGCDVYEGKLNKRESISDNFIACYRPEAGLYIKDKDDDLVLVNLNERTKQLDKTIVKDKEKLKFCKKILLKK